MADEVTLKNHWVSVRSQESGCVCSVHNTCVQHANTHTTQHTHNVLEGYQYHSANITIISTKLI